MRGGGDAGSRYRFCIKNVLESNVWEEMERCEHDGSPSWSRREGWTRYVLLDLGEAARQTVDDRVPVSDVRRRPVGAAAAARPAVNVVDVDAAHARASSIDGVIAVDARAAPIVQPVVAAGRHRRPSRNGRRLGGGQEDAVRRRLARRHHGPRDRRGRARAAGAAAVETAATLRAVTPQLGLLGGAVTANGEAQLFDHV